jgi:2-polyprenyl-3-methyl-5-hydroxy-6-metoxy-1,4-benzoquinol methylase
MTNDPVSAGGKTIPLWHAVKQDSALGELVASVLEVWPDHEAFLEKSIGGRSPELMRTTQRLAALIHRIVSLQLATHAEAYKWTCAALNKEVFHFIRHRKYRYSSFAEVQEKVYDNPIFMTPYVRGLLLSQILWENHSQVVNFYLNRFFPLLSRQNRILEIGPGHGLFCALAAEELPQARIEAWDVSPSSLEVTRESLGKLGLNEKVALKIRDVVEMVPGSNADTFDGIVISEVLEHLENPVGVLRRLASFLEPGGKVFINVPVNSPSPDHIYLLRTPEEAKALAEAGGFRVLDFSSYPVTGYSEEEARRGALTISCAMVVTPNSEA